MSVPSDNQQSAISDQQSAPDRYSRQTIFPGIGVEGQRRLGEAHVTLCGCGALGTVLANSLARAGVGHLRIVDRDFLELHNLQRQVLFDENDVSEGLPKAEAAARKLEAVNSSIHVEPVVTDVDHTNIVELTRDADLILDGTDNFETRFLINDVAVKLGLPWVYGGCIGSHGQTMTIIPGQTPCLRCVIESAPPPGMAPTCETAGILGPIVNVVASLQAAEALKILTGQLDAINRDLIVLDVWDGTFKKLKIAGLRDAVDCPTCKQHNFEWLDGKLGSHTTSLCGRNAVQIAQRTAERLSFEQLERRLSALGTVSYNRFMLKFEADGYQFTVFPDGRAIIKGTNDVNKARTLYAQYIGH